ncbi:MAG: acyl-CoA N-acyltransferase [Linnemannia gamsii]|nr:MAG: acyl-CoA N-acyltransferase [Linnemannia gamsii]
MDATNTTTSKEQSIRGIGPFQVSPSLWLTPIVSSDAAEQNRIFNINDSFHKGLYSAGVTFPFPLEASQGFVKRLEESQVKEWTCYSWAIRTTVNGPMIGLLALDPFDHGAMGPCYRGKEPIAVAIADPESLESNVLSCGGFGYWLSPEHGGKGIMTEVVDFALTKVARQEFGYDRVHGEAWMDNVGSRRVMERAGMRSAVGVPCFVPKFNAVKDIAHYIFDTDRSEQRNQKVVASGLLLQQQEHCLGASVAIPLLFAEYVMYSQERTCSLFARL